MTEAKQDSRFKQWFKKRKLSPFKIIGFIVLLVYTISMLSLMIWGVSTSLKTQMDFRKDKIGLPAGWPWEWEWSNIAFVFSRFKIVHTTATEANKPIGFWAMLLNTLVYAGGCAVISALVTCVVAYLTTNFDYPLSKIVTTIVIVTMILPIVGAYPSEMQILKAIGVYNTRFGAWVQKFNFLGMYFLVFQATFKSMSKEYSEAASIDGASEMQILLKIIFPIVRNTLFTIIILNFVALWNDYQAPLLYFPDYPTLTYGLYFVSRHGGNQMSTVPMKLSIAVVVLLPILIIFMVFRNRILGNVTMGGVKE